MPETELSLGEVTARALDAAAAGDLDALAHALQAREAAIGKASPSEQAAAFEDGETVARLLVDLKQSIVVQHNRLEQIREGFGAYRKTSRLDVRG